mgnify:CR=1 FL=1
MRAPRGITYGRSGYPVYCCHCHALHEVFAIDRLGHWVEEHPLHDPDGEVVHIHDKDPAAWPERYYERVGALQSGLPGVGGGRPAGPVRRRPGRVGTTLPVRGWPSGAAAGGGP